MRRRLGKRPGGENVMAAEDGETAGRRKRYGGERWGNSRAGGNVMAAEKMQHKKASNKADAFKKERFAEF